MSVLTYRKPAFGRGSSPWTLIVLAGLAGCASVPSSDPSANLDRVQEIISSANSASAGGDRNKALSVLEGAAKQFPANKEPWLRLSQMHFESGNYGQAIVSAQEVVQRDPENASAKSILAVAGLRVATRALADLRGSNGLAGDTRTEAETLAKALRESLGESVLVPPASGGGMPPAAEAATSDAKPATRPRGTKPKKTATVSRGDSRQKVNESGDPFGSLR